MSKFISRKRNPQIKINGLFTQNAKIKLLKSKTECIHNIFVEQRQLNKVEIIKNYF